MWTNSGLDDNVGAGYIVSPGMGSSQATFGDQGKRNRTQNLIPVTAAQLMSNLQTDDSVHIGQESSSTVVIVGLITAVDIQSTLVSIQVDDMSGPIINIKQWIDQGSDAVEISKPLVENCYVKVYGGIRQTNGELYLVAHSIKSITDLNELTNHLLEVLHTKLILERGFKSSTAPTMGTYQSSTFGSHNYGSSGMTSGGTYGGDVVMAGLTNQQQAVYQAIRSFPDENGCGIDYLMKNMKGLNADSVKKAINFLSEEGHIYSTVDDDHFKATDS